MIEKEMKTSSVKYLIRGASHYKLLLIVLLMFVFLFSISSFVTAQAVNNCCEKTLSGAWCQNSLPENCDPAYRSTSTSCESTSFCKPKCCVDSDEGLCSENTPERVCNEGSGTSIDDAECNVPQCSLGCCILGDQASFVTLQRCKKLSGEFGLKTNFRNDIRDEVSCIEIANSEDKGACVFNSIGVRTCRMTTRGECNSQLGNGTTEFFNEFLCSADELATDCGPSTETTCVEGNDEVYFMDTCGNPANIYDSKKIYSNNPSYWQRIVKKEQSCNPGNGNTNSKTCGNCNYLQGSVCGTGNAQFGSLVCKDLNCYNTENGNTYKNGESWCIYQSKVGNGKDVVGSRHYRHICVNGEELVEPCADFRNEVCLQESISTTLGNFEEASCINNRWKDCIDQNSEDCSNRDLRTCYELKGVHVEENDAEGNNRGILNGGEICLPDNPPGLKFWTGKESGNICDLGNARQVVKFEKKIIGSKKCVENCEALSDNWIKKLNNVCTSLGDCGASVNIAGDFSGKGAVYKRDGNKRIVDSILEPIARGAL
jgi:hypothetical protein